MAPSVDIRAHSPPAPARIPKLKYRNPLPEDRTSLSSRGSNKTGNSSTYAHERSTTPDTNTASATFGPSIEVVCLTSPSLASISSSATSSNGSGSSTKKKKKKSGAVFGFWSLKEPSQIALEQFAEAQRKQTASKGPSTPLSKHSTNTYVGQKLPPSVPKVNSKWDGVPDSVKSVKHRHSTSAGSSNGKRVSWPSRVLPSSRHESRAAPWNDSRISIMTMETGNPPNSVASAATSMSNFAAHEDNSYQDPATTTTFSDVSCYFSEDPSASAVLPVRPHENQEMVKSAPELSESISDGRQSTDTAFTSRASSPVSSTDSVDTIVRDVADSIFRKLKDGPQQDVAGEPSPAVQYPDAGFVPHSHDFLFDESSAAEPSKHDSPMSSPAIQHYVPSRPVQNFSRPIASPKAAPPTTPVSKRSSYRTTPASSALPTLYEASPASSTESLATVQNNSDAQSITPSTIAPSELSQHWYDSPRERLGLGGRLRLGNDVSPWDVGGPLGKPKKNRLSLFGRGTSKD